MQNQFNVTTAPKTGTFQMRINPEVRREVESIYAHYGLTLTDAVNMFFQQSLNEQGCPFLLSPENEAYQKAKAVSKLMEELQKALDCPEEDWLSADEVYRQLGLEDK